MVAERHDCERVVTTGSSGVIMELQVWLGDRLDVEGYVLNAARADKAGHVAAGGPMVVLRAESVHDVQATLRFANANSIPVVTRGGGDRSCRRCQRWSR